QEMGDEGKGLTMHINISGNDIAHKGFISRVTRALAESGLKPQDLTLELTENILMARLEDALPMLAELHTLGVRLSVDDFGTGCSSLSHLSSLPFDSLKIVPWSCKALRRGWKPATFGGSGSLAHEWARSAVAEGL